MMVTADKIAYLCNASFRLLPYIFMMYTPRKKNGYPVWSVAACR